MPFKYDRPTQKGTKLYPGNPPNPPVVTVEIVPSQDGDPQADFIATQQILADHEARLSQFVQGQRQNYSLSGNQITTSRNTHQDVDIRYVNQFGAEHISLLVRPQPTGGVEPKEVLSLSSPCLMVLYGSNQIAAIPMSQLKSPTKLSTVHKGKLKSSLGTDLLLTAQYKFAAKGPSVVFCPINVDTKRALTVTDNFYLSAVGGHAAFATGPDAVLVQAELDATGGRAFTTPIKTSLPRVGHSTAGVKYATSNPRIPTINANLDGATIYTPLDVYKLDAKGTFTRTEGGGDANSLPYVIGQDGTYFYWPQWGPAHPQTSVMLNLGYAYYEPLNTSRNISLGQTHLVPVSNYPQSLGGSPTTDFSYDTPANLADTYTASTQTKGLLTTELIAAAASTGTATTLTPVGYHDNLGVFDIFGDGNTQTIVFTTTTGATPMPVTIVETDLLGFGYYSTSSSGDVATQAGVVTASFGYAIPATDGSVASIAPGRSSFSGQAPYPFYTVPSSSGPKKDTLSATLTSVTASDGDHLQLVPSFEGPDGVRTPTRQTPDVTLISSFHLVIPRDNAAIGIPLDAFPVGSLCGAGSGGGFGKLVINYNSLGGPGGIEISLADLYAATTRQVNDSKLVNGTQSIQFLGGNVAGSSDPTTQKRASFLYLEPFPPSLDTSKAYYSIEQGDIAGYPGPGSDVPLANSVLSITTPYGNFSGSKFQPWLHVSNGRHYIQGFQIDGQSHLYLDSTDITPTLPKALSDASATFTINDVRTVIMDVPLGVIKKLR